jgi:putative ABC transport system substrate-binding protein
MDRRAFLAGTVSLLAASLATEAQPATTYRVGLLAGGSPPSHRAPLTETLRELGYVEGQNLLIESRYAEGRPERLPSLAAELVQTEGGRDRDRDNARDRSGQRRHGDDPDRDDGRG